MPEPLKYHADKLARLDPPAITTGRLVRHATLEDVPSIVKMAMTFLSEPPFSDLWRSNADCLRDFAIGMIERDRSTLFVALQSGEIIGMIGAAIFSHPFSGECIGQEIGWWVNPSVRGPRSSLHLLRVAEDWARARGAQAFQVQAPTLRVGQFYEALGFSLCELSYHKRFV